MSEPQDHVSPPDSPPIELDASPFTFDEAHQRQMEAIGQALVGQSLPGTVAVELVVTQTVQDTDVHLDLRLQTVRQSGIALPAVASDDTVAAVQAVVRLWRTHQRDPFRGFTYRLTRGESGPRFSVEFDL